ncbi:MAG: winged helix-turn-helix domain-containing protein [Caulobacteraceae bacterium]
MLARRPGEVVTKDELYERALRRPREPYDRSVDVHVSNLRQKIHAIGHGVEIETARGVGYRLRGRMRPTLFLKILGAFWLASVLASMSVVLIFRPSATATAATCATCSPSSATNGCAAPRWP